MSTIGLRAASPEDRSFLCEVYASTRETELASVPWSTEEKTGFLEQQFDAQDAYYKANYEGASYDVILVDGERAGRLYVARWPDEIRIMDIALLPAFRRSGVGTALLQELLTEAAGARKRVSIHVEVNNPARSLYERLGFSAREERFPYVRMECAPAGEGGP